MKCSPFGLWNNLYHGSTPGTSLQSVTIADCKPPTSPRHAVIFLRAWADAIEQDEHEKTVAWARRDGL